MTQPDLFPSAKPEPPPVEVMAAIDYDDNQDPRGLLMSEKLDGVRAIWNGRTLRSRSGNLIHAPGWWTAQLPSGDDVYDGELWAGRGRFQDTLSYVRKKQPIRAEWEQITYCVFDAPRCLQPLVVRLAACAVMLKGCPVARHVPQYPCRSRSHFEDWYAALLEAGAEGVVLRDPNAMYEPGPSASFLRCKPRQTHEAEVIGYEIGTGRNASRTGALVCTWNGRLFKLANGLQDVDRENPPPVGALVTFSHQGTTNNGKPRFPVYITERNYE